MVEPLSLNFRVFPVKLVVVRKFRNFTVFLPLYIPLDFHQTVSVDQSQDFSLSFSSWVLGVKRAV